VGDVWSMETKESSSIGQHTLTHTEMAILKAKPTEEPDRAKIKWPKRRKFKVVRGRTETKRKRRRPATNQYRVVLEVEGVNLHVCQRCGKSGRCHIHHVDSNPWNNTVANLQVLCKPCHEEVHGINDEGVVDEQSLVPLEP